MTNEDVLRDRLAAAVDETDRLRAVADRLAKELEIILTAEHTIEMGGWMDNYADVAKARAAKAKAIIDATAALDEYRKAVSDAR